MTRRPFVVSVSRLALSPLAAVLLLALAMRLLIWAQPLHQPANDEVEYIAVARDLLAGRGWVFYESYHWLRAPLYPLFLAASLWLAGGDLQRAALPNIALSLGLVWLIYQLAYEIGAAAGGGSRPLREQRRAPLLAAMLAALLLTNATFASLYMAETLFAVLFAAAFLLVLCWRRLAAPRWADWRLLLAALCFGLAVLTRSAPLFFLPLLLGWLVVATPATPRGGRAVHMLPALAFALVVACTIAPWTLRNCRAYGQCILVETGLSYNLWAFSEPREDQDTIFRTLESIANPAARADEATRRGLARLREDPAILLRKLWPNWVYTWRVKPIQDRFLQASYRADPPAPLFLAALLLDDLLVLVILVAGLAAIGMAGARRRPEAWLLALWLAYFVTVTVLTHGESRYRHFLLFALVPYAAVGLSALFWRTAASVPKRPTSNALLLLACLPALLVGYTFLRAYPYDYARAGGLRSMERIVGDAALARGDLAAAEGAYRRAIAAAETPDGWLALARLHAARGEREAQADALRAASVLALSYPLPHALLGDLLREDGRAEAARRSFVGRYVAEATMATWAWDHLRPLPMARIDLGAGLDFGYITGFYPAETLAGAQARWSDPRSRLRLPGNSRLLRMRIAAPWPDNQVGTIEVCAANVCQQVALSRDWRTITLLLPPASGELREIELRSGGIQAADGRTLGALVDWVEGIEGVAMGS